MHPLKLFVDHPRSVNETYWQHAMRATYFAVTLLFAGCACLVHAVFPFLFKRSASELVHRLHTDMVTHRVRQPAGERTA